MARTYAVQQSNKLLDYKLPILTCPFDLAYTLLPGDL